MWAASRGRLAITVRMDNSVEFIASSLRRSPREVRDKLAELEQSGDLRRLVERISAFIAIDEDELFLERFRPFLPLPIRDILFQRGSPAGLKGCLHGLLYRDRVKGQLLFATPS
jgi:hypothetical protein